MPPTAIASPPSTDEASVWHVDDWLALAFAAFLFLTPPLLLALCAYAFVFHDETAQWVVAVPAASLVAVSLYLSRASTRRRCR